MQAIAIVYMGNGLQWPIIANRGAQSGCYQFFGHTSQELPLFSSSPACPCHLLTGIVHFPHPSQVVSQAAMPAPLWEHHGGLQLCNAKRGPSQPIVSKPSHSHRRPMYIARDKNDDDPSILRVVFLHLK